MKATTDCDAKLLEIVCDQLEIDATEIGETARFIEDCGADSLDLIALLAALECEFKVTIDDAGLRRMVDLKGVRDVLAAAAGR